MRPLIGRVREQRVYGGSREGAFDGGQGVVNAPMHRAQAGAVRRQAQRAGLDAFDGIDGLQAWRAGASDERKGETVEFSWVGETARHVGTVVHRCLQRIGQDGMRGWDAERIRGLAPRVRGELQWRGVLGADLDEAAARALGALAQAVADPEGRWVLGPHAQAASEYRVTAIVDGARRRLVMDRVFTDAEGGRWIVDFKTGRHEGADVEAFLDRERERYAGQLRTYAAALGGGPRLGLYFPLVPGGASRNMVRIKAQVPEDDCSIDSVTTVWVGADWHEREAFDMFGIVFKGHPDLRRILLPEDWEGHPLRKDYPVRGPEKEWPGFLDVLDRARKYKEFEWHE